VHESHQNALLRTAAHGRKEIQPCISLGEYLGLNVNNALLQMNRVPTLHIIMSYGLCPEINLPTRKLKTKMNDNAPHKGQPLVENHSRVARRWIDGMGGIGELWLNADIPLSLFSSASSSILSNPRLFAWVSDGKAA
jgi:hypothetical protein